MIFLADANVLIALAADEHTHHLAATKWLVSEGAFAVCPITEGALLRYFKRLFPKNSMDMRTLLERIRKMPGYTFWSADLSHEQVALEKIIGHSQVTDAYLVALAKSKGGRLATFDEALAAFHPEVVLIPSA